jgi:hypothetical protein
MHVEPGCREGLAIGAFVTSYFQVAYRFMTGPPESHPVFADSTFSRVERSLTVPEPGPAARGDDRTWKSC